MITSILGSMRRNGYSDAVAVAVNTLQPALHNCTVDEFMDEAMHAMNACRQYVKKGRLRKSFTPDGRPCIQIVTRTEVINSPSIQQLVMWADVDTIFNFLASSSGISTVINSYANDNPF